MWHSGAREAGGARSPTGANASSASRRFHGPAMAIVAKVYPRVGIEPIAACGPA